MCVICELENKIADYSAVPKRDLELIFKSWERERMRVLSSVPFDVINRFIAKIDKHFDKILRGYK